MNPEEFRAAGHQVVDWIADYRARVETFPVMARTGPGEIRMQLPAAPPEAPEPFAAILDDLDRIVVPGLSHWQHPSFFGYFPCNGSLASVLGDYVSTGLGVLGLAWQSSPALTEIEEVVTDWMRSMLGLSSAWSGVIQDTASTGTLIALSCARERTTGYSLGRGGLQGEAAPLIVYTSAHSHNSVDKAALLAGVGRQNIRVVPHDARYAMRADALAAAIAADRRAGHTPCAVVATSGSTTSTAFDPIAAIAEVAAAHRLWLHVDAAMAGSAMILPECRAMWDGVERADSLVVNPHKWLGAAFDNTLYYVRDAEHLVRVMSTNPSYLQSAADGRVKNRATGGSRSAGASGRSSCGSDPRAGRVRPAGAAAPRSWTTPAFLPRRSAPPPGASSRRSRCRRSCANPPGWGEALDRHTLAWVERINRSGAAYLTPAILDGRWMVRVSIGAETTERSHVDALWRTMRLEAER
jgi:aromatic-L-amino-acid decarboxylase